MKTKPVYYADFETTQPNSNNEVKVYLWCILKGVYVKTGNSIESFIEEIKNLKGIIYFHNLKFDFSYIHYYILTNNIDYKIIEKKGVIYSVKFFNIELRDSMNFLPMSLKEVGDNYCVNYKKTSIDYNVNDNHIATSEEIEYCINDCRVLEEGLTTYITALKQILTDCGCVNSVKMISRKLTNAGIAYEVFKELSMFNECCPKTTRNQYEMFKGAYHGGFVYSNPLGIVKNVKMIDCNSMYPFIYSTIDLPIGNPFKFNSWEKLEKFKFYIVNIYIKYELKKGYIAIIGGGVSTYGGINYKSSSNGEYEKITVCSTDLKLIKRYYECDIMLICGWGFDTKPYFFKEYADTFIKVKNSNKGVKRAVAKVLLNSPYGKTAMNGLTELKTWKINEDNIIESSVTGYECNPDIYQYLPIAIQITAGARELLLTTAEKIGFENVHYMDTDSIKFSYNKNINIETNPDILGMWKDEGLCELFKTIAPKKYVTYIDGVINYTCAGIPKKILESEMLHNKKIDKKHAIKLINKFDSGLKLPCLQSKVVKGGRALLNVLKEIK